MRNQCFVFFVVVFFSLQSASAQVPVMNSLVPNKGAIGTVISITGSHLGNPLSLKIGTVPLLIQSNSSNKLTAMIIPGSVSGKISIVTSGGADSSQSFLVTTSQPPVTQVQKLTGTGTVSDANVGISTAISADNNNIALGGAADSLLHGAVWVYSRNPNGQWIQRGNKLVPTDASPTAQVGQKLAISGDGNTLITGGILDDGGTGAAWIFTKDNNGNWQEQAKLVGTGAVGPAYQGCSVAISADGNTAVVGGYADSATILTIGVGAVWVFQRDTKGVWKQQGSKLIGIGANGSAGQGYSVAISADGNTIMEGGIADSSAAGAVWVFTRGFTNLWKQVGSKLTVTTANALSSSFGFSVALNADGTTAVVGTDDNNDVFGGAWVFVRDISGIWQQQGTKLVGNDTTYEGGLIKQGRSVGISADGNTIISGAYGDNFGEGAAWIFTRQGTTWSEYGYKLAGSGAIGQAQQGYSVSLSADGTVGLLGGFSDNAGIGACWVFADTTFLLPVNISSFSAYPVSLGVQTVWTAYNEININHYIIERSADGNSFQALGTVVAKGNTAQNNYRWFDVHPFAKNNFYRLQSVDKKGIATYSQIIKISLPTERGNITISPNPTVNKAFSLRFKSLPAGNYNLVIYNSLGEKVYSTQHLHNEGDEVMKINTSNVEAGIYYVQVTGDQYKYAAEVFVR